MGKDEYMSEYFKLHPGTLKLEPCTAKILRLQEIKQKAWEYFLNYPDKDCSCLIAKINDSFNAAQEFCDFANEKENI